MRTKRTLLSVEDMTRAFNEIVLPRVENGMTSGSLLSIMSDAGFNYCALWPMGLEASGYLRRELEGCSKALYFEDDPARPGMIKPLHINQCTMAWNCILKHRDDTNDRYMASKAVLTESNAIVLLKSLGYRIMKPTTTYEEV